MAFSIETIEEALRVFDYSVSWQTLRYGFGYHLARRIGGGFRYEGVKPFEAYPNPRRINWKQTDKLASDEPLVNVFREEHEIDICFVADLSRSMDFGNPLTKRDRLAKAAALIAYAVRKSRDRFAFVGVTDEIEESVTLPFQILGRQDPLTIAESILLFDPQSKGLGALADVRLLLPRTRSLLFLASDFLPTASSRTVFFDTIAEWVERHDVVPLVIRDSLERDIPQEGVTLYVRDSETADAVLIRIDEARRREFEAARAEEDQAIRKFFDDCSIEPIWLWPETDEIDAFIEYFAAR